MSRLFRAVLGARKPRGLSQIATIIIAAIVVILGWQIIMHVVGVITGLLWWAIHVAVMILVLLILIYAIKTLSKKV